jgi:hypothetical protein
MVENNEMKSVACDNETIKAIARETPDQGREKLKLRV